MGTEGTGDRVERGERREGRRETGEGSWERGDARGEKEERGHYDGNGDIIC